MPNVFEEWLIEAKAEAKAAAKAEGKLEIILHLVSNSLLTKDVARAVIEDLMTEGTITRAQAEATMAKLG